MTLSLYRIITLLLLLCCTFAFGQVADSTAIANAHFTKGNKYNDSQRYDEAIIEYLKVVTILEKQKDTAKLVKVYTNIGVVNARLQNLDKAILYLEKSLNYVRNNDNLKLQVLSNISSLHGDKKDIEAALEKGKEAENLAKKLDNEAVLSNIYSSYCNLYRDLNDFDKSIDYGLKSLELKEKLKLNPDISINNIGYSFLLDKQYDRAIQYFKKIEFTNNKPLQVLVLNNFKRTYQEKGAYQKALNYANKLLVLKDSLGKAQQKVKVASLIEKYESEKKQQQIDVLNIENQIQEVKLNNQKILFGILALIGLLASVLIYQWFRNQKIKQSLKQAAIKHKLLQTQLNPHFLFHSLNSIQSFIHQNKKEESSSYLVSYSKLMRSILESSDKDFITVEDDLNAIKDYIKLQRLNLSEDVQISIDCENEIRAYGIPPMFIQPFVENALLHGMNENEKGMISISYIDKTSNIQVIITDNGKGLTHKKNNNELHRSMSSEIINQRVKNLRQIHNYQINITTEFNTSGTSVLLEFPKKL